MLQAVVDEAADGLLVTDPRGRVIYANAAYLDLVDARDADDVRPVERVFIGDPDVSEAVYRLLKAAREGRRAQEEVRVTGLKGKPVSWLRLRVRPLADGKQFGAAHGLGRHRRDARPRAAGEHLPGAAARHRLSRPCAGGLLLGRCQGRHPLHQRDARGLARPRSGASRLRRTDARRHRLGQRRGAPHHARRCPRRGEDRGDGPRLQDPLRPHAPGAAVPQGRVRRRRHAGRLAHAGAQPRAGRCRGPRTLGRSALHALLPVDTDGDRQPSTRPEKSPAPIRCLPGCSRLPSRTPKAARSSPSCRSATARRWRPRSAARPRARARSLRSRPRSAATASAGAASTSLRSKKTTARPRPRSSTCSTPRASASPRTSATRPRR